jgi:hypothetical protein
MRDGRTTHFATGLSRPYNRISKSTTPLMRNYRKEFDMAKETKRVEIPAHLRPVLQATAKNLLHHLYGPDGPPWGTSFSDIEEIVVQLSRTLGSELLSQSLQRQANQAVPQPLQHCPTCGRPTEPRDAEPRSVQARLGTADWKEPSCHCEHCRKSFFPSVQEPGH